MGFIPVKNKNDLYQKPIETHSPLKTCYSQRHLEASNVTDKHFGTWQLPLKKIGDSAFAGNLSKSNPRKSRHLNFTMFAQFPGGTVEFVMENILSKLLLIEELLIDQMYIEFSPCKNK